MATDSNFDFDLNDLAAEVFDLSDEGLTVESLTAGHGLVETGASFPSCGSSCSSLP
ncbi:thiomuracin/GE37468 family thiazolyl RiPP peptide [Curtobacterium sp. HSID17257]|uniref:thiomuracin/GE37468 family thiazolyl RiPP peptide n=1 Tax=Curtobacterium sp. HSID17257 TaxID=2419510 RepID=UPI000F89B3AE|nr:thiomuracin/GE37468 family thiazolyl RiPP peptide [Curtobacterium sp. HSID17257]RUQ10127.1 GE37468 family thiazolyl peptide [Curtobacterium sp. HSID17257]